MVSAKYNGICRHNSAYKSNDISPNMHVWKCPSFDWWVSVILRSLTLCMEDLCSSHSQKELPEAKNTVKLSLLFSQYSHYSALVHAALSVIIREEELRELKSDYPAWDFHHVPKQYSSAFQPAKRNGGLPFLSLFYRLAFWPPHSLVLCEPKCITQRIWVLQSNKAL